MKHEFKFKYEASPVSEIVKLVIIEANNIDSALIIFRMEHGDDAFIHSIDLI